MTDDIPIFTAAAVPVAEQQPPPGILWLVIGYHTRDSFGPRWKCYNDYQDEQDAIYAAGQLGRLWRGRCVVKVELPAKGEHNES